MTRHSFFRRTLLVVVGTLAVLSVAGSASAQQERPAPIAPGVGLEAPLATAPAPRIATPRTPSSVARTSSAAPASAAALQANRQSENGLQADLRAWLKQYTPPRVFTTA